jgi:hypothetical protein
VHYVGLASIASRLVYVVVLNLAIEYVPSVISEGFTLSLLTAVLLKVTLELVIRVKNTILDRLRVATTRRTKVVAALSLWVVAAGSKLVVLELVDLVFGDSVSLGGFIPVTLVVFALLMSRAAVRRLLYDTPAASRNTSGSAALGNYESPDDWCSGPGKHHPDPVAGPGQPSSGCSAGREPGGGHHPQDCPCGLSGGVQGDLFTRDQPDLACGLRGQVPPAAVGALVGTDLATATRHPVQASPAAILVGLPHRELDVLGLPVADLSAGRADRVAVVRHCCSSGTVTLFLYL